MVGLEMRGRRLMRCRSRRWHELEWPLVRRAGSPVVREVLLTSSSTVMKSRQEVLVELHNIIIKIYQTFRFAVLVRCIRHLDSTL